MSPTRSRARRRRAEQSDSPSLRVRRLLLGDTSSGCACSRLLATAGFQCASANRGGACSAHRDEQARQGNARPVDRSPGRREPNQAVALGVFEAAGTSGVQACFDAQVIPPDNASMPSAAIGGCQAARVRISRAGENLSRTRYTDMPASIATVSLFRPAGRSVFDRLADALDRLCGNHGDRPIVGCAFRAERDPTGSPGECSSPRQSGSVRISPSICGVPRRQHHGGECWKSSIAIAGRSACRSRTRSPRLRETGSGRKGGFSHLCGR